MDHFHFPFQLPVDALYCLGRAFVLGIIVSSQALLARQKRVGFERHLILFSTFSFLMAAEIFGLCLGLLSRDPEVPGPPPAIWVWYPVLSTAGLLGVAFCFDFVRGAAGEPNREGREATPLLRKRSRWFLAAVAILFAFAALASRASFLPGDPWSGAQRLLQGEPPTSFSQMRAVSFLLHGIQAAGMALLAWEAFVTRGIWLSRPESRVFLLGAAAGLLGAIAQVYTGPREPLTTLAFTLFVAVFLRDSYRRSELEVVRASEDRTARMLLFHRVTTQLKSASDLPRLYEITLDSLLENLGAESGAIYVRWDREKELQSVRVQGPYPSPLPIRGVLAGGSEERPALLSGTSISQERAAHRMLPGADVIGGVAATGAPLYIAASQDAAGPVGGGRVKTAIALPLRSPEGIFGVIHVVNRSRPDAGPFSEEDLRFMSLIAEQAGLAIYNARLQVEVLQRQRAEEQLRVARDIQLRLIPSDLPRIEGISLGAEYLAAEEVGGDYFDFYHVDHDHLGVVIFDVAGRGVPGALLMAITSTFFNMAAPRSNSPAWVLNEVNAALSAKMRRGLYVTALYGVLRLSTLQFTFVCAGHTDAILIPEGRPGWERHKPGGAALGLLRPNRFRAVMEQETLQLRVGDTLLLYTDGVVEARNEQGEQFGEKRLCDVAREHAHEGARKMAAEIKEAVRRHSGPHPQEDDLTVVAIRIAPEPSGPGLEAEGPQPDSSAPEAP